MDHGALPRRPAAAVLRRIPILPSLNGGELSPLMNGRVDIEKYATGAQTLENMIPKLQGPVERRGGTLFIGEGRTPTARIYLPKFTFDEIESYTLEMGDEYFRFFTQRGQLEASPGVPYEIAHNYPASDLTLNGVFRPSYVQSRDQVFWANSEHPPKVLSRLGATNWTWDNLPITGGPFKDQNEADITARLSAVADVGDTVVLTVTPGGFEAGHVGSLFELEHDDVSTTLWDNGLAVAAGSAIRWDGRFFTTTAGGTTGTIPPTHSSGTVSDGGVSWTYRHDGRVIVKFLSIIDGDRANVEIMTPISGDVVHPKFTRKWAFGAWSQVEGWPSEVAFFRERLVFGRGTSIWLSCAGDYTNFAARTGGLITAENAISLQIANARADEIKWLQGAQNLLIGTAGGISVLREQTVQLPFGPGNVTIIPGPVIGAAAIPPLETPSGQILYVDRTRTAIRAISYSSDSDTFQAPDITRLAEHVLSAGVVDVVYQAHRDSIVWCLLENGELAALSYDAGESVFAWSRHKAAGPEAFIEAIQVIPSPVTVNRRDDLWMVVLRTFDGIPRRYVEVLESAFIPPARQVGQTQRQWRKLVSREVRHATHLDSALAFNGTRAAVLNLPATPQPIGAVVSLPTGGGAGGTGFLPQDVGQYVQVDYSDDDGLAQVGEALITAVDGFGTATATITYPLPVNELAQIDGGLWRVTRSALSGLSHLEGCEVAILADGGPRPLQLVTGGDIVLDPPAAVVKVGLPFRHRYVSMPPETGAVAGTAQGRMKRAHRIDLRVFASLGSMVGTTEEELNEVRDLLPYREAETLMGRPSPLFFGDARLDAPGGFDTDGLIVVTGDEPLPFTLVAVIPFFEVFG